MSQRSQAWMRRGVFGGLLGLVLCLPMPTADAAAGEYYVDSAHFSASDTNPGTLDQPWLHCPGMPEWSGAATLQPGDTVYFRGGEVWEVARGMAALQVTGGVTYDGRTWGDGKRAILRATGDLPRSLVSFMDDHPHEPTSVSGFELDANGRVTTGAGINWPHMQRDVTGAVKRIADCEIHGVRSTQSAGEYEYGIVVSSWLGYKVANVELLDNVVHDISRAGICNYLGNDVPENRSDNVLIRGNEVYDTGRDTTGSSGSGIAVKNHASNSVVEYNYVHDTVIGINVTTHPEPGFRGPENLSIRHNLLRDCRHVGLWISNSGDKSLAVHGNLIAGSRYEGLRVASSAADRLDLRIYSNTFYQNYGSQWSHDVRIESNSAEIECLEFRNNIIYSAETTRALGDDDGDLTNHSNNLYFRRGGGTLVTASGARYAAADLARWEPTALTVDPLLVNRQNLPTGFVGTLGLDLRPDTNGLSISPSSPARDYGAPLDLRYASSINSITRPQGAGWDLGAYELDPAAPGPSATRTIAPTPSASPTGEPPTPTQAPTRETSATPRPTATPSGRPTAPFDAAYLYLPRVESGTRDTETPQDGSAVQPPTGAHWQGAVVRRTAKPRFSRCKEGSLPFHSHVPAGTFAWREDGE